MATVLPPVPSSPVARYWVAMRPYSFTAAVVPVVLGSLVAVYALRPLRFDVVAFLLCLVGAVAVQVIANVVNDYFDAEDGIDRKDNTGALNAIVRGVIDEDEAKKIIAGASVLATALAVWFLYRVGWTSGWLIVLGGLLAFFYTAPPVQLKHRALGDVAVALGFGLGIGYGAYLVQAQSKVGDYVSPIGQLLVYTLPSLLLVVAILHANNHRDRETDAAAGARTVANSISFSASRIVLQSLLLVPYLLVLLSVVSGLAAWPWLFTLVTLPLAFLLERRAAKDDVEGMYVPDVAKLHGMFGIVGAVALLFARFVAG